jgi:multidrug resistance efflux pump
VKVVQRLDVRLRLLGALPPVRSGLSAEVTIDTRSGPPPAAAHLRAGHAGAATS